MNENQRVKLSQFAKDQGITYQSAWKMWKRGEIDGIKLESGTILVSGWANSETEPVKAVIYVRVNDLKLVSTIKEQIEEAETYCSDRGYDVVDIVSEVISGIDFNKPKLVELLNLDNWNTLVIIDKRAIASFGFNVFAAALGKRIVEPIHEVEINDGLIFELFTKFVSWSRQVIGMNGRKRDIMNLMNRINY